MNTFPRAKPKLSDGCVKEEGAHNWDAYFQYLQDKLRSDPSFQRLLEQQKLSHNSLERDHATRLEQAMSGSLDDFQNWVRSMIDPKLLHGDIFEPNFGLPAAELAEQFDITTAGKKVMVDLVISNFTSESATSDWQRWEIGLRNIMSTVKPSGELVLTACLEADHYLVGDQSFPAVPITENDVLRVAKEMGFQPVIRIITEGGNGEAHGYTKLGQWCFEKIEPFDQGFVRD